MPKPYVPCMVDVEAFLVKEPIEASPVNAAGPVLAEPLQVPKGPIPKKSILGHPMGSNIQDILDDLDLESENSIGMRADNVGHPTAEAEVVRPPLERLSLIREAEATFWIVTPTRPQSLTPALVNRALGSKRPCTSEASEFESFALVQPLGANWTVGGKLARLRGDLKGNPF